MRKFLVKLSIFLSGLIVIFLGCIFVSSQSELFSEFFGKITNSSSYSRDAVNGGPSEINPAIDIVQAEGSYTKLVLGDSVSYRLFTPLREQNDDYLLLGTNQAIGMMGQYLLAEQFIENHEIVTDIYIVMIANSFKVDFGTKYGYQYAVMPFVEMDLFQNLDNETIMAAKETYGELFLTKEMVEIVDYSEMNRKIYLNLLYEYGEGTVSSGQYTSDIVARNIFRLAELCEEKGVNLHLLPGPMPDTENINNLLVEQEKEFISRGFEDLMEEYYDSVTLYPEEWFPDGVHPGGEYGTREILDGMIEDLQKKSGKLEGIVFLDEKDG